MPTLGSVLRSNAHRFPDREALVHADRRLTWAELDRRVDAAVQELTALGLAHGDRCMLMAANSDSYLVAAYAVFRLGAILVPVNVRLAVPEVRHIASDSGARMIVHDDAAVDTALAAGDPLPLRSVRLEDLVRAPDVNQAPADVVVESDDALILYTSGTTGRAKGVVLDHHREIWAGACQLPMCGLREGDRYLHLAPLYHGAGLTLATAMLLVGGTQVVLGEFEPAAALRAIEEERITVLLGVPTMFQMMLREPDIERRDLGSWRVGVFGAAPMPEQAVRRMLEIVPEVELVQQCGQTEAGPAGVYASAQQTRDRPDASGRQAFPFFEARVVDEHGVEVTAGSVGELVLRGESVMKGYWRRPEETAQVLRDGWLYTGDLVRVDSDGYLTVVDRMRDLILTGGRNVYSVEVELAVSSCAGVADCAVVGRPHEDFGETVVAVVSRVPGGLVDLGRIRAHCARLIADYKLPREVIIADIPRNASGKILKSELRARLIDAPKT